MAGSGTKLPNLLNRISQKLALAGPRKVSGNDCGVSSGEVTRAQPS